MHFHAFGSMARTAIAGRWKHEGTAKVYINGAAAEWASWQISDENNTKLKHAAKLFRKKFEG